MITAFASAYDVIAIKGGDLAIYNHALTGFKDTTKANITEYTIGQRPDPEWDKNLIKTIRSKPPDLILAIGINAVLLVKEKIDNIPIVYCMVIDPEKHNLADNDNITGIAVNVPVKEQLSRLKGAISYLNTVGVIYNPENTAHVVDEAKEASSELGIDIVAERVISERSVPKALRKLVGKIDVLWLIADQTVVTKESFNFIMLTTFENNIPVMTYSERFVEAGAMLSLSTDYSDIGRQAAVAAEEILKEKKMAIHPKITNPDVVNLSINLKIAGKFGIKISADIVNSAHKVFK